MEDLSLEQAKLQWKTKLEERLPDVKRQLEIMKKGQQIPYVSEDCPEKLRPLAERLVELQINNGEFRREDITSSDMNKIKDISKATGSSFREVIAYLVKNDAYVNYEVIDARHIIRLLEEFDSVFDKYYDKFGEFPMNTLSPESRRYFKNNKNGLNNIEKLQGILEIYRPKLSNIHITEHNYNALPKSRVELSEQSIEIIKSELNTIAKNGNIDAIFSSKYEKYFKNLCAKLKLAGYTFDRFINEYTDFRYTLCFKADILPAVKQMVKSYYDRNGTSTGITNKDPYLRYKIETAQNVSGCFTTKELFEFFGIKTENFDNNHKLSQAELDARQKKLFQTLAELYPDKIIKKGFATKYDRLYDELSLLSRRFGYNNMNAYLTDNGFSRIVDKKSNEKYIYLSECDLNNYEFISDCQSIEEIDKRLKEFGICYIDPYENLGIYKRLIYDGLDSTFSPNKARTLS